MEDFPTELELTAASALLLLSTDFSLPKTSTTTTSLSNLQEESVKDFKSNLCEKSVEVEEETISLEKSSDTTPCRSLLTSDYSVSTHRLQLMVSAVARYRSMKLKVARRARTKVIYRGYNDQKSAPKSWAKPQAKTPNKASTSQVITEGTTTTTTESSCLSSGGTSEISSGRNRGKAAAEQKRRRGTGPTYISRRAEAILRLLSCKGCASEVRIRQLLGDSPDTSKALRMLLRMEEVKRSGAGGRIDPFIYTIADESNSSILN